MDYLDVLVRVSPTESGEHEVRVRSLTGEATDVVPAVLAQPAFRSRLEALRATQPTDAPGSTLEDVGSALFHAMFGGPKVRAQLEAARTQARAGGAGLRLRLQVDAADLVDLPWEYLYDPARKTFLARSDDTLLVRFVEVPKPVAAVPVRLPLRILGVVAAPHLPDFDAPGERERLDLAVEELVRQRQIELTWLAPATWRELQHTLDRGRFHALHLVAQDGFDDDRGEGFVVLGGDAGEPARLSASGLAALLGDHAPMRLVVATRLGQPGSFWPIASTVVHRGTPAVITTPRPGSDRTGFEFYRAFYAAVANGVQVDAATASARAALPAADPASVDWGAPVLFSGAADGVLFDLGNRPAATAPPSVERAPAGGSQPRADPVVDEPNATAAGGSEGGLGAGTVTPTSGTAAAGSGGPPSGGPKGDAPRPTSRKGATPQPGAVQSEGERSSLADAVLRGGYLSALVGAELGALVALLLIPELPDDFPEVVGAILMPDGNPGVKHFLQEEGLAVGVWLGIVAGASIVLRLFRAANDAWTTFLLGIGAFVLIWIVLSADLHGFSSGDPSRLEQTRVNVALGTAAVALVSRALTRLGRVGRL